MAAGQLEAVVCGYDDVSLLTPSDLDLLNDAMLVVDFCGSIDLVTADCALEVTLSFVAVTCKQNRNFSKP